MTSDSLNVTNSRFLRSSFSVLQSVKRNCVYTLSEKVPCLVVIYLFYVDQLINSIFNISHGKFVIYVKLLLFTSKLSCACQCTMYFWPMWPFQVPDKLSSDELKFKFGHFIWVWLRLIYRIQYSSIIFHIANVFKAISVLLYYTDSIAYFRTFVLHKMFLKNFKDS